MAEQQAKRNSGRSGGRPSTMGPGTKASLWMPVGWRQKAETLRRHYVRERGDNVTLSLACALAVEEALERRAK